MALAETQTAFAAWCFMIACALRPSEALNMRMKSEREHQVPLSTTAIAILERQARVRTGDAVFPGPSGSLLIDAACPHGWRSVFRDWAGDIGDIQRDLAESALAHSLGSTEASYRRLTAVEKRRLVMESYAQWLNSESAQVIAFPTSKKA
jgi:integrase